MKDDIARYYIRIVLPNGKNEWLYTKITGANREVKHDQSALFAEAFDATDVDHAVSIMSRLPFMVRDWSVIPAASDILIPSNLRATMGLPA